MRIAVLTNRDIESNLALNLLAGKLHGQIVGVFLSDRVGSAARNAPTMLDQLSFVEQDLFNEFVFPAIEAQAPRNEPRLLSFSELGRRLRVPVRALASVRDPADLQELRKVNADVFISIRFGKILGDAALGIPSVGVLNLHSGLLPDYRGVLATFRALMNGDPETGCTLHWIDSPGIDTGPIIDSARIPVDPRKSLLWHLLALYPPGVGMIARAIEELNRSGHVAAVPQVQSDGAYYSFPTHAELGRFAALGWRLFDREDMQGLFRSYGCASIPRV